jgi:hypothetical protein
MYVSLQIRILNDEKLRNLPAVGAEVILGRVQIVPNQDYKEKLKILHDRIIDTKCSGRGKTYFRVQSFQER